MTRAEAEKIALEMYPVAEQTFKSEVGDFYTTYDVNERPRKAFMEAYQIFLDDNPIDEYGLLVAEEIPDGRIHDPVGDEAVLHVMIQKMHNRLELLPSRERRLLMYRYGIDSLEYKTIEETAAFFHLTEKYLRIIETRTLGKLRDGMNDGKIL